MKMIRQAAVKAKPKTISQDEYTSLYIEPYLEEAQRIIKAIVSAKDTGWSEEYGPDTPSIIEKVDKRGRPYLEITQWYDLPLKAYREGVNISEALLEVVDNHQNYLKLKNPLKPFLSLKNLILSLPHSVKIIPNSTDPGAYRETEIVIHYARFSSLFSAIKKAVSEIKVNQDTTLGTGEKEPVIVEEEITPDELDVVIKKENILSEFVSKITKKNFLIYRQAILTVIKTIKASPFKKVLNGTRIMIGTSGGLVKKGLPAYTGSRAYAHYYGYGIDCIAVYTDRYGTDRDGSDSSENPYVVLIHELGHRYHHNFLKDSYSNQSIINLFKEAKSSKKECYTNNLPKLGDPLSNFREDWWTVRMASEEYFLTSVKGNSYTFTNSAGDVKLIEKKDLLKRITCPSQYGAKNEREFFAEMFTLITLGLVKPTQKVVADKFMKIIKLESK